MHSAPDARGRPVDGGRALPGAPAFSIFDEALTRRRRDPSHSEAAGRIAGPRQMNLLGRSGLGAVGEPGNSEPQAAGPPVPFVPRQADGSPYWQRNGFMLSRHGVAALRSALHETEGVEVMNVGGNPP